MTTTINQGLEIISVRFAAEYRGIETWVALGIKGERLFSFVAQEGATVETAIAVLETGMTKGATEVFR